MTQTQTTGHNWLRQAVNEMWQPAVQRAIALARPRAITPRPSHQVEQAPPILQGYKVVKVYKSGRKLFYLSVYDDTQYIIGQRMYQRVGPGNHNGGFYVQHCDGPDNLVKRFAAGDVVNPEYMRYGQSYCVLSCKCEGPFMFYTDTGDNVTVKPITRPDEITDLPGIIKKVAVSGITPMNAGRPFVLEQPVTVARRQVGYSKTAQEIHDEIMARGGGPTSFIPADDPYWGS